MNAINAHHGGQYPSYATHSQYPPPDLNMTFHSPDYAGYFADGPLCSPLEGQHQHSLVPVSSSYSTYDDCLGHYEHYAQPPAPPILPSSNSSELGHALVETPPPESQSINHGSITLPSLSMPSPSVPKHEISDSLAGLNAVKTEYADGQPFSPITSLSSHSTELAPHPKEEGQDQVHGFTSAGVPHGGRLHHRQHTHDSFRLVQDPAAYQGYTSSRPSKVCSPPSLPLSLMLNLTVYCIAASVPRYSSLACLFS
jgi:hypothetical protein